MLKEAQEIAMQRIERAGDHLVSSFYDREERLIKALLLLNSGGIVTILTYMHETGNPIEKKAWLTTALTLFLFGLVASFFLVVRDYYYWKKQLCCFSDDIDDFENSQKTWQKIRHFAGKKGKNKLSPFCMWVAITFIVFGVITGMFGYFNVRILAG